MTPGSAGAALMPAARTFIVFHPRLRAGDPRLAAMSLLFGRGAQRRRMWSLLDVAYLVADIAYGFEP